MGAGGGVATVGVVVFAAGLAGVAAGFVAARTAGLAVAEPVGLPAAVDEAGLVAGFVPGFVWARAGVAARAVSISRAVVVFIVSGWMDGCPWSSYCGVQ